MEFWFEKKIFFGFGWGFGLKKNFFSGSGRVSSPKNFFRVGFGLKIVLFAGLWSLPYFLQVAFHPFFIILKTGLKMQYNDNIFEP